MEIIRGLHNLTAKHRGNVVTIGNFDGVHLAHQTIISQLVEQARQRQVPAMLVTFQPGPQQFFARDNAPARLTNFYDKIQLLKKFGIDRVLSIAFDQKFADMSANDFIDKILIECLETKYLIIGDDFQFGKKRQGDFHLLQKYGEKYGFSVESTETYTVNAQRVSSTIIRHNLAEGNLSHANTLLGRCFHLSGKIRHGDKRGRTIGFPTANIFLKQQIAATNGVYAVKITGLEDTQHGPRQGVANLGVRPTIGGDIYLLEVHLFDFDANIYGRRIAIQFEHFIRPEQKFEGLDALVNQIKQDVQTAKHLLGDQQ